MADQLLDINIEASRTSIVAQDEPQLLYMLVTIGPAKNFGVSKSPINLCLVVDRSTSMTGLRLQSVKAAARTVFEELAPEDVFSLVTFSDRAETIWSAGEARDLQAMRSAIERIGASGGTEIFQGLQLGVEQIHRSPLANFSNHLIIFTDGHTYGDDEACLALARKAAADGINISAFGIGPEWNDRFLDELAGLSGGETAYLESPGQVHRDLHQRIQSLGETYARNLHLFSDFPEEVKLSAAFRVAPVAQPLSINGSELRLGSVRGQMPLTLLLEFIVTASKPGQVISVPIALSADIPSKNASKYMVRDQLDLTISDQEVDPDPPDLLLAAVQAWNFHLMNEKAWDDIEAGDFHRAQTRLRLLSTRLFEAGHSGLAQKMLSESQRLAASTTVSLEGRKKLKFSTRALVTGTMKLPKDGNA
ncbi:MAG TPA: VWA domain-containing protein [Patescibacteria group bacterium]|nr:VWA domain-containing protein [Patescibacteria group bacterium]